MFLELISGIENAYVKKLGKFFERPKVGALKRSYDIIPFPSSGAMTTVFIINGVREPIGRQNLL